MAEHMVQLTKDDEKVYPKINIHMTEIISKAEAYRRTCANGYPSNTYCGHSTRNKTGVGNKMYEYYGGIYIPNIEDYEILLVELNYGGNSSSGQLTGGIVLYETPMYGIEDSEYGSNWQNRILMPTTTNYCKVSISKVIYVGDRKGEYSVGSLWDTYSGNDFGWNAGFGNAGSTLRVIGFVR